MARITANRQQLFAARIVMVATRYALYAIRDWSSRRKMSARLSFLGVLGISNSIVSAIRAMWTPVHCGFQDRSAKCSRCPFFCSPAPSPRSSNTCHLEKESQSRIREAPKERLAQGAGTHQLSRRECAPILRNSDSLFGGHDDLPLILVRSKPHGQKRLHPRMIRLAHISLLQLPVHVLPVRPIGSLEVLAERDLCCGGILSSLSFGLA